MAFASLQNNLDIYTMRKLILVLLFIGFQLQLLAQESTEPQRLNKFYGGIEAHVFFPTYSFVGFRFGSARKWSFESALGIELLHYKSSFFQMNQMGLTFKSKKNRYQQIYFGEYIESSNQTNSIKLTVKEYFNNVLNTYYDPILLKWRMGALIGYRTDILTSKLFRLQGQGSLAFGNGFFVFPQLGIRLTTK